MTARIELTPDGGRVLHYATEFDIRDGLAAWAEMDGWNVETEHVMPGWGRPDLYLTGGGLPIAVEIKVELATQAKCRKAVQQADNYRKAMPEVSTVFLVAAHVNREAMAPYAAAYPSVQIQTVEQFFGTLAGWVDGYEARHLEALRRLRAAEIEIEKRRAALSGLSNFEASALRPWTAAPPSSLSALDLLAMFDGGEG